MSMDEGLSQSYEIPDAILGEWLKTRFLVFRSLGVSRSVYAIPFLAPKACQHLHDFTDAFVALRTSSVTVAFSILSLDLDWSSTAPFDDSFENCRARSAAVGPSVSFSHVRSWASDGTYLLSQNSGSACRHGPGELLCHSI